MNVSASDVEMRGQVVTGRQGMQDAFMVLSAVGAGLIVHATCNCSLGYALRIALPFPKVVKDPWDGLHIQYTLL